MMQMKVAAESLSLWISRWTLGTWPSVCLALLKSTPRAPMPITTLDREHCNISLATCALPRHITCSAYLVL